MSDFIDIFYYFKFFSKKASCFAPFDCYYYRGTSILYKYGRLPERIFVFRESSVILLSSQKLYRILSRIHTLGNEKRFPFMLRKTVSLLFQIG